MKRKKINRFLSFISKYEIVFPIVVYFIIMGIYNSSGTDIDNPHWSYVYYMNETLTLSWLFLKITLHVKNLVTIVSLYLMVSYKMMIAIVVSIGYLSVPDGSAIFSVIYEGFSAYLFTGICFVSLMIIRKIK